MKPIIVFDLSGTLVQRMRPPELNGSREFLVRMQKRGIDFGIYSGARTAEILNILLKLDMREFFPLERIVGKEMYRKPDPNGLRYIRSMGDTNKIVFIGDKPVDRTTAELATVKFISCLGVYDSLEKSILNYIFTDSL